MWTEFDPAARCITFKELKEIGENLFEMPTYVHGHGPGGWFGVVRIERGQDKFKFRLQGDEAAEGEIEMKDGCLSRFLRHAVLSKK